MRAKVNVKGVVQGVGFRPYVYNLASSLNLKGYVSNTSEGVGIDIEGENIPDFIRRLSRDAPTISRIVEIKVSPLPPFGYPDFRIIESTDEGAFTLIPPDMSLCKDCLRELFDPEDRRYLYPFINCTNCGPRYTITKSIPYDRPNTTMSSFRMCPECKREYDNPKDRRFHAEPNACSQCGPHVKIKLIAIDPNTSRLEGEDPIFAVKEMLKAGYIVSIKGLGGFHIACDATNESSVKRLRERKRKSNKPFALMAPDIETIERFCHVNEEEKMLLLSSQRPIVLLRKRLDMTLLEAVSPDNQYLGFMLPYTPIHYLLFKDNSSEVFVMTSGNMAEEPIVRDNDEALERLSPVVDAFLFHNRDIFMGVDDSVVRWGGTAFSEEGETVFFLRRARGYVPEPIEMDTDGPDVLAVGADIKNTFTITKGRFAIPSQHIGDMENYETLRFFEECLKNIKTIYRAEPIAIAYDLHPDYLTTTWALKQEIALRFPVQHHYAHITSVMAEKGIRKKVIGVAFDGTGYGTDGSLWGGEFLIADLAGFQRAGHLRAIPLPGGETAIRQPWRTALSYVIDAVGKEAFNYLTAINFIERYGKDNIERLIKVIHSQGLSPLSSGAGRLFDAVSAIMGICDKNTFEGEAAMALESFTVSGIDEKYYFDMKVSKSVVVDFSLTIIGIMEDLINAVDRHVVATKFHNTVSDVISTVVRNIAGDSGLTDVILSGGTFQNMYLLKRTIGLIEKSSLDVYINENVPCNDAGISLGQAYIARERLRG